MSVKIRNHRDDKGSLELYTELEGVVHVWGVVSVDMMEFMDTDVMQVDLDTFDRELITKDI